MSQESSSSAQESGDDLPERNIREDEGEWHASGGAGAEASGIPDEGQAYAPAEGADRFETTGKAPEPSASPSALEDDTAAPEAPVPVRQAAGHGAEPPAQHRLPGLDPADVPGRDSAPERALRSRRPRPSPRRRAPGSAQAELWPPIGSPDTDETPV
jgi:hypothetical protein